MTEKSDLKPKIYNIEAGTPFARTLAGHILNISVHDPKLLSSYTILLPTRRACRLMAEAFFDQHSGPMLLPRMQPIGHIDEEELTLSLGDLASADERLLADFQSLKPALSPLRRQILLTRMIMAGPDFRQGADHAVRLAGALGRLMDQVYTEGLSFDNLQKLVPAELAEHWQITTKFLEILAENWPKILSEQGVIDSADRRERLIRLLTRLWQERPPQGPVIAAGTTGSIPATAALLKLVCRLPQGQVVLPGYDPQLDDESWNILPETHPQYGFKQLFERMDILREQVAPWPHNAGTSPELSATRRFLAREIMRPAQTSRLWQNLATDGRQRSSLSAALENLHIFECHNEREEAHTIAVLIREALEDKGANVALVTPDRSLARRVSAACLRWGIAVDDSAGQTLDRSDLGQFLILSGQACRQALAPVAALRLFKHPYFAAGLSSGQVHEALRQLEMAALRGLKPRRGFEGLRERLKAPKDHDIPVDKALELLDVIDPIMHRFTSLMNSSNSHDFKELLKCHLEMCEALSDRPGIPGQHRLWAGETGTQAADFLAELLEHAKDMPSLSATDYIDTLQTLLRGMTLRSSFGLHPRVRVLGQIEARLIDADTVILAGLNEGTWPSDPGHDPWMSPRMRSAFGLPSEERGTGLAAHDFVQGLCARRVILTRAARMDGVPRVPSRWLQRLGAVLKAAHLDEGPLHNHPQTAWAAALDRPDGAPDPCKRPQPCPPAELRPRQISATDVQLWLQDPYGLYAKRVLQLKPLDPLEQTVDHKEKGNMLHAVLERFTKDFKHDLPEDTYGTLMAYAKEAVQEHPDDPAAWQFWLARFERSAGWLARKEEEWRRTHRLLKQEIKGTTVLQGPTYDITLSAKADRIDLAADGAAVIDYKSSEPKGGKSGMMNGKLPQLPVEALILSEGGFEDLEPMHATELSYWILGSGNAGGAETSYNSDTQNIVNIARDSLHRLAEIFADETTPYLSIPNPENLPPYSDYAHLARIQEWSAMGESDEFAEGYE